MAATESIRALRDNPTVFSQGVGSLFGTTFVPSELSGVPEEQAEDEGLEDLVASVRADDDFLEESRKVVKEAAKLQAQRRDMEAFNLMARSSVDFARIATCLTKKKDSSVSRAFAQELGTKSAVNLLRQAREDGEATAGVRDMAAAALEVLRADPALGAALRAHCIANFATLHGYLRDWGIQKELCEEVLELQASCLAADDPDVVRMKQHLGVACLNLGEWSTARRLSEEVLQVQLRDLGAFHVDVAWTKRHLGVACGSLGDKARAQRLCLEALEVLRSPLDSNHLEVARMLRSLGVAFGNLGDWQKQNELCEEALTHFQDLFGDDHIDTAMTKRHLGAALARLGGDSDARGAARAYCQEAFEVLQEHLGDSHLDVARARCAIAEACDASDPGGAEMQRELFEEALEVLRPQLGEDHLEVARARIGLGAVLGSLESWADSRRLCLEALVVLRRALGDTDSEVAWAKFHTAAAILSLESSPASEKAEAKQWLQEARCVLEPSVGPLTLTVPASPKRPQPPQRDAAAGPMGGTSGCLSGCCCWPHAARQPSLAADDNGHISAAEKCV